MVLFAETILSIISIEFCRGNAVCTVGAIQMTTKLGESASIKNATDTHGQGILECLAAAFAPYQESYTVEGFLDTVLTTETIHKRLRDMSVFVATDAANRVVGTISCKVLADGEGHLRGMAVRPEWQGAGISKRLLQRAELELRQAGCRIITLDTTEPLKRAVQFYTKNGFRPTGKVGSFFGMPLFEYSKPIATDSEQMNIKHRATGSGAMEGNVRTNNESTELRLKIGLAEMLKGGVIMDVTCAEQAAIAEKAGASAVMALERVPAQIRAEGGVARMASPKRIREIMEAVTIPVMAKCRIGHFAEAQVLQELGVDYIDESEVLTPADEAHHVDKHSFKVPFVCGARNLGEALRRIAEGAAMIRTKGEAGTGDVIHAVKHMRQIMADIRQISVMRDDELYSAAKAHQAPLELIRLVASTGRLPVPNFSAGGIATAADASLVMQLGAEAVFVGSGIFMKNSREFAPPEEAALRARAIVRATTHFNDPKVLLEVSQEVPSSMIGTAVDSLNQSEMLQTRGW
jgi:pyridoxal 5'-phosphate synthase pdxS subunit